MKRGEANRELIQSNGLIASCYRSNVVFLGHSRSSRRRVINGLCERLDSLCSRRKLLLLKTRSIPKRTADPYAAFTPPYSKPHLRAPDLVCSEHFSASNRA